LLAKKNKLCLFLSTELQTNLSHICHVFGANYTPKQKTVTDFLYEACERNDSADIAIFENDRFSYGRMFEEARNLAAGFNALGVKKGDAAALWSLNTPRWLVMVSEHDIIDFHKSQPRESQNTYVQFFGARIPGLKKYFFAEIFFVIFFPTFF